MDVGSDAVERCESPYASTVNPLTLTPMFSAAVMPAANVPLRLEEFTPPNLERGAALLRTLYSEVCGTDVHLHHGRLDVPFPIIPGHVSVGVVEAAGGRLKDIEGKYIKEGDTVTFLDVAETCNNCWFCLVARQPTK